ncbi:adenylate/guanylate cyclase domain-containing protein [Mycolicibacterium thermoresistibile]
MPARTQRYAESVRSRYRILTIAAWIAAVVSAGFGTVQLAAGGETRLLGIINLAAMVIFLLIPLLYRFGELIAPLAFFLFAYLSVTFMCFSIGTGSGLQLYLLVAASLVVLLLGVQRIVLSAVIVALGVAALIGLEFLVPHDRGLRPDWALDVGFVTSAVSAAVMIFATVWYALREIARTEAAMEAEYQRSESLLTNILPASVARRLKEPGRDIIADRYDDASVLFADIAGYTQWAGDVTPTELVLFLDRLYAELDALVDEHGLEKIKTSGDSYMVVSGVPQPRADHLEAVADFALAMADAVGQLRDPQGRAVPLRIGLAAGPVVAGVVGSRKFFYDVWGDAVNVASRMESTDVVGRIQVPHNVFERLNDKFDFEERGEIDIKGKGVMRTWYLLGRRADSHALSADSAAARRSVSG